LETNDNLSKKLESIGLDIENIPDKLNFFQKINFRVRKNYIEKNYKVYRYIDINDIEIFLTPTNRLTDYTEKYAKALPIGAYLSNDTPEDIERNIELLNIIKEFELEDLEILENQQLQFSKNIPYNVKYNKDYLWQIFYSEASKKYFMLAPIKESECAALFFAIKKQIQNKTKKVYVPICYADYSNKYLNSEEMEELEKYLCYFTKEWPSIYEVYDKEDNMSIQIVGKAVIYDTLQSEYKITLEEQGETEDFYKLLKALFILETQLAHHYKFDVKIDKNGGIHFYFEEKEIQYEELIPFIKKEYVKGLEKAIKAKESKINLEKRLKKQKNFSNMLDEEYFERERQITTFLECKKSFFGKVRYFLKNKKKKIQNPKITFLEKEEKSKLKYCERTEIKDVYTLEELLELYQNLDQETNAIKDLELDIEAMNQRIQMLEMKIKNATQYIMEIDKHKKSIFEFWKFTNKEQAMQLNEGAVEAPKSKKLKKVFNYETDFEDLAKQYDKLEREIYTKEETDNIHIATTNILEDINKVANGKRISEQNLETLKKEMKKSNKKANVDIFGSLSSSKDKIKTLGNIKHRENEKNKFAILGLKEDITLEQYTDKLKEIYQSIEQSMGYFKNTIEVPVYKTGDIEKGLNIFYMNPENALKQIEDQETELHKIVLKENVYCIPLTNTMYYNNTNQTLPLGMHVSDGILIDTKKIKLELKGKKQNYIIKTKRRQTKTRSFKNRNT